MKPAYAEGCPAPKLGFVTEDELTASSIQRR
jgi:hypothetical protein